jgi:hypothetical protein
VIEGQVVNQETHAPIAYANVGIPGKYIGTAGNDEGFFILTLPTGTESDTLQVSAIGFKTKRYEVVEFKKKGNQTVFLQPRTYSLNTVTVVDDKDLKTERIGTEKVGFFQRIFGPGGAYGEAGYGKNLGASYAFRIEWKQSLPLRVLHTQIELATNKNDWPVQMRCRLQKVDPKTGWPGEDLAHQNVFSSAMNPGWIRCDFTDLDVIVDKHSFFVVFEWLPHLTDSSKTEFAPLFSFRPSLESDVYVRRKALGRWEKLSHDLKYRVEVEY